jgi:hypothetical protein
LEQATDADADEVKARGGDGSGKEGRDLEGEKEGGWVGEGESKEGGEDEENEGIGRVNTFPSFELVHGHNS